MKFTSLLAASALLLSASFASAGTLDTVLEVEEPIEPIAVEEPAGGSIGVGAGVALVLLGLIAVAVASGD